MFNSIINLIHKKVCVENIVCVSIVLVFSQIECDALVILIIIKLLLLKYQINIYTNSSSKISAVK